MRTVSALIAALIATGTAAAGEADVTDVQVTASANGFRFAVTVRHDGAGWDHYADRWEVVGPGGEVLAVRVLAHPHENEQPFTQVLAGVEFASEIRRVRIRAHDSVHGDGGAALDVELPRLSAALKRARMPASARQAR